MEKLVYQMFISGIGEYLDEALHKGLGGVIFFTKDIKSKEQFKNLINDIKTKCDIPPFLSIDQEGGRVERTENIHARYLSPRFAFARGEDFLKKQTEKIARELKEYGINLNFAPCADVNTNPDNPIIGERAFSDKTDEVIKGVAIVSEIYRKNGIIPCLKHYPGHGDASQDSHLTLPVIDLSLKEMEEVHIKPFADTKAEMIMAAHLHCTCFDKDEIPASLSKNAIGYLRNILKYDGVVITDDMEMQGVNIFGNHTQQVRKGVNETGGFDAQQVRMFEKGVNETGSFDSQQVRKGVNETDSFDSRLVRMIKKGMGGTTEACIMAIMAGVDMFIFREANENFIKSVNELVLLAESDESLKHRILESNDRIQHLKRERLV